MRPPIDEVSDEDGLSTSVSPRTARVLVAKTPQQCLESLRLSVDVADDVKGHVQYDAPDSSVETISP